MTITPIMKGIFGLNMSIFAIQFFKQSLFKRTHYYKDIVRQIKQDYKLEIQNEEDHMSIIKVLRKYRNVKDKKEENKNQHNNKDNNEIVKSQQSNNNNISNVQLQHKQPQHHLPELDRQLQHRLQIFQTWMSLNTQISHTNSLKAGVILLSQACSSTLPRLTLFGTITMLTLQYIRFSKDMQQLTNGKYRSFFKNIDLPDTITLFNYVTMIAGGIMLTGVTVFGLRVLGAKIIVRKIENWRKDNRKFR